MNRSGLQRIIPIVIVLLVAGLAIFALISLGRAIFSGGGQSDQPVAVNSGKQALINTSADRSVRMTVRGPIVAQNNFHSYTIEASPDKTAMTTYVGYIGQQVATKSYENNTQAYTQFVNALDKANMMEGTLLTGDANNTDGVCARGNLYLFAVLQGTNVIQELWTSTCRGSVGSLKANMTQISTLYQRQIPDFTALIRQISMSST